MEKRSYHHGDLRQALIEAGLTLLEAQAADALSLREVARAVGVSATAVYRHFPDKGALLDALAAAGLEKLAEAQRAAAKQAGGGQAGFAATGIAYVRFAAANPALFRMIFGAKASHDMLEAPRHGLPDALTFLRENAAAVAAQTGTDPRIEAIRAWSLVHGLALLLLDQQIVIEDGLVERIIAAGLL
jgi:AcrR family transcriptional regulator